MGVRPATESHGVEILAHLGTAEGNGRHRFEYLFPSFILPKRGDPGAGEKIRGWEIDEILLTICVQKS